MDSPTTPAVNTEFSVNVGGKAYGYGKESEGSFDIGVHRLCEQIQVHFFFKGSRHHVGTLKTSADIARWLAYALLAATEGASDARINRLRVRDDEITERITQGELFPGEDKPA